MHNLTKYEKSCGAVIFYKFEMEYKVLLIGFIHGGELKWGGSQKGTWKIAKPK